MEEDNIGQLFRTSFEAHKDVPESGEWEMLQTSMQKVNFFKFNALQFNIYYASTILFCFLTCLTIGSHYTYSHILNLSNKEESTGKINKIESVDAQSSVSEIQKPSEIIKLNYKKENKSPENSSVAKLPVKASEEKGMQETYGNNTTKVNVSGKSPSDTTHSKKETFTAEQKQDTLKKPKRTLYITKQDTIYQYDTLKAVKKKNWKLK